MSEAQARKEGSMVVGVAAIFAYLIGSLIIAFVLRKIAASDDFVLSEHGSSLGYALLFIALGVVGQAVREGRGLAGADEADEQPDASSDEVHVLSEFLWPLGLLVGPLLAAWLQFELFFDNVRMFPVLSIVGGIWLGMVLGGHLSGPRYRSTVAMLVVALFTFPLGVLSIVLPAAHFRTYGSNVVVVVTDSDDYSRREYPFEADLPDAPTLEAQGIGVGTSSLLGALAEAKPVEGVVIDDVFHVYNEAGELVPAEMGSMEDMFAEAAEADARERERELEAYALELAEHEANIARLRRGGRLFSSPEP